MNKRTYLALIDQLDYTETMRTLPTQGATPLPRHAAAAACVAIVLALASCAPVSDPRPTSTTTATTARVVAVIDGDTITVATDSGTARVRIIGINTPEIGRNGKPSQCYADQARTFLDDLVYDRTVTLTVDPSQVDTDKYGRLLRHVSRDGQNIALTELRAGMGPEYTYDRPYAGRAEYTAAEAEARAAHRGLWGSCPAP